MNRRRYLKYASIFMTGIPTYIKNKYFEYTNNINKEHSVWDINYAYNPLKLQNIDTKIDGQLQIHTINVAQSDSTLIITPENKSILIDTGHFYHKGKYVSNYLDKHNINTLNYLILTHPHWDHIGGASKIIKDYEIKQILYTGQTHDTNTYNEFMKSLEKYPNEIVQIREEYEFDIKSKLDITVMNPEKTLDSEKSINNNSLVLHITYNDSSILLPADAEKEAEKRLLNKYGTDLQSDIYKVGHHGDKNSSQEEFLNTINPETAIISSAYYSEFGYPDEELLKRLQKRNIDTYWTGINGSIVAISDGTKWEIYSQSKENTSPLEFKNKPQVNYPPSSGFSL